MATPSFIFGEGQKARTPEELKRMREIANAMSARAAGSAPRNIGEGLTALGQALSARMYHNYLNEQEGASQAAQKANMAEIAAAVNGGGITGYGGGSIPADATNPAMGGNQSSQTSVSAEPNFTVDPAIKDGIAATAQSLGIDPTDLATAISYETAGTFDPTKGGPTTKWGRHRGLIQFGEPQAAKYGVNWDDPIGSQLGPDGAVAKYLRDTGVKPGMGLMDIYSAINAGGVGRYNRSDAAAGGAPGTVADKVNDQMAGHRAKALAMFGGGAPVQTASLDPSAGVAQATQPNAAIAMALRGEQQPAAVDAVNALAQGGQMPPAPMGPQPLSDNAFNARFGANAPQPANIPPQMLNPQPMGGQPMAMAGSQPQQAPQAQPPLTNANVDALYPMAGGALGQGGQGAFPAAPQQAQGAFPAAPAQPGQLDMGRLIELASDPNTPELGQMIVQTLLKQRLTPPDPMDALNLEKTRLEIDAMRNPQAKARPMTAEERQQWGIPPEDTRPYAMTQKGPELIGGGGQTINIGGEVEARKAEMARLGIGPDDPRYAPYALTGKMPRENEQPLTATDKKAILEADEQVLTTEGVLPLLDRALELNPNIYEGFGASKRAWLTGNLGSEAGQATMDFDNIIGNQALQSLKATFGGNPTEGERKILLDLQGLSDKPAKVRAEILQRAKSLAERRLNMYRERAKDLRGGTYYTQKDGGEKPSQTETGKRLRFNPETGELE